MTPGQALVMSIVMVGLVVVVLWGLVAGELDRKARSDLRDSERRLRRELDRQGPPRWHR